MVLYYTLGYTPSGRYGHSTVLLYDTLYMWGGGYDGLPYGILVSVPDSTKVSLVNRVHFCANIDTMVPRLECWRGCWYAVTRVFL